MPHTLSEYESKRVLSSYGIPVVAEETASNVEDAVTKAAQIGYPVVLKLCGAGIGHKTERDLVRLELGDADDVRAAAVELLAKKRDGEGSAELLVQAMVRGRREIIVGLIRDHQFGPCIMLGLGGILAEAMRDVVFRVAPIDASDAEEMIGDLKGARIFGSFRGEPPVDQDMLVKVLIAVGRIGVERKEVLSLDVNPLIIASTTGPRGELPGSPIAVDALVEIANI
jgi:acetyl-CoA synthetase (ADP-forming)